MTPTTRFSMVSKLFTKPRVEGGGGEEGRHHRDEQEIVHGRTLTRAPWAR